VLKYQLEILPVFFALEGQDQLTMLLEEVEDKKAAAWVEAKILQFGDSYLRLETSNHDEAKGRPSFHYAPTYCRRPHS
jgi:hypothetical protein